MRQYFVYILANKKRGVLYIGVTGDLLNRIHEHKSALVKSFTSKYNVYKLVYYEIHEDICGPIYREKQLKKWLRNWKIELIEKFNPNWKDLYYNLF